MMQPFDFTLVMDELQKGLTPNSRKTLAKIVDVYSVSQEELDDLRADLYGFLMSEDTGHQACSLAEIMKNGLPTRPEKDLQVAPDDYGVTGTVTPAVKV